MEPTTQPQGPEPVPGAFNQQPAPRSFLKKVLFVIGAVVGIIAVLFVAWFFVFYTQYSSTAKLTWATAFDSVNFSFVPTSPIIWTPVDVSTVALPPDLGVPLLAFKRENSSCVLVYTDTSAIDGLSKYKQSSYAPRVYFNKGDGGQGQIDFNFMVHENENYPKMDSKKFFARIRTPLPKEVMTGFYYPSDLLKWNGDRFTLFDATGSIIPDNCIRDTEDMLATLTEVHNPIALDQTSDGLLYIQGTDFFFTPEDEKISYRVAGNPFGYRSVVVKENRLYGVVNGRPAVFDPFGGTTTPLATNGANLTGVTSDMFLLGDTLYILTVADITCLDSYDFDDCESRLFGYNFTTGALVQLEDNFQARTFYATNNDGDTLYFVAGVGDAGCVSYRYWAHTLADNTTKKGPAVGSCASEDGSESQEYLQMKDAQRKYLSDVKSPEVAQVVSVQKGKLVYLPIQLDSKNYHSIFQAFRF